MKSMTKHAADYVPPEAFGLVTDAQLKRLRELDPDDGDLCRLATILRQAPVHRPEEMFFIEAKQLLWQLEGTETYTEYDLERLREVWKIEEKS